MTAKKIQSITLKNFKAFYGEQTINFNDKDGKEGKNVLIYGENGSGKSSLARALELLILGENGVQPQDYRNIAAKKDSSSEYSLQIELKTSEKIKFDYCKEKESRKFKLPEGAYHIDIRGILLDYKKLADIHYEGHISLILNSLFGDNQKSHFIYRMLEILFFDEKEAYKRALNDLTSSLSTEYNNSDAKLFGTLSTFHNLLSNLKKESDFIGKVNENLEKFFDNPNSIKLSHIEFNINIIGAVKKLRTKRISFKYEVNYQGNILKSDKCSLHLNEAKLSAISLSIHFALLQMETEQNAAPDALKILILDDALTGLDMSNRLPVVKILNEHFTDYQIFFLTHDREFYERIGNSYLKDWKKIEMYRGEDGFASPVIYSQLNHVEKANFHLEHHRYDVAGNFLRKEAERIVKELLPEVDQSMPEYEKPSLGNALEKLIDYYERLFFCKKEDINCNKEYRGVINNLIASKDIILNPFSHHNWAIQFHEYEVREAFKALKALSELPRVRAIDVYILNMYYPCFLLVKEGTELSYKYPSNSENPSYEAKFTLQDDVIGKCKFKCTDSDNGYHVKVIDYVDVSVHLTSYKYGTHSKDELQGKRSYTTDPEKMDDSDKMINYFKNYDIGTIDKNWWYELSWVEGEGKITKTIGEAIEMFKECKQSWLGAWENNHNQPQTITILEGESLSYQSLNDSNDSIKIKLKAGIKLKASLSVRVEEEEICITYTLDDSCKVIIESVSGLLKDDEVSDTAMETTSATVRQTNKKQSKETLCEGQNLKLSEIVNTINGKLGVVVDLQRDFKTAEGKSLEDLKNEILKN